MTQRTRRPQGGFTLLEFMVVTVLSAIALLGLLALWKANQRSLQNANAAVSLAKVSVSVDAYTKANRAALLAAAGPTTPVGISWAQLYASGGLDPNFPKFNSYGQTYSINVIQPTSGTLYAMVTTYGGQAMAYDDVVEAAQIAVKQGAPAGYTSSRAPLGGTPAGCSGTPTSYSRGAFGDWCAMLAPFGFSLGSGYLQSAIFYANASTTDDYLHRSATAGSPELNQMSTNIDMNGNAVNNASNVRMKAANQGVTFYGGGESVTGSTDYGVSFTTQSIERMRLFNDGHLWLNNGTTIQSPGGGNVIGMAGSWLYGDSSNMALRPAANGGTVYIQGTASGGGTGNLYVAGVINAVSTIATPGTVQGGTVSSTGEAYANGWFRTNGDTGWYSQKWGGGWYMSDSSWVRCYNNCNVSTGGQVNAGNIVSNGRMTANEYFQVVAGANVGTGCSPGGLLGRDATGSQLVQCKNGVWSTMGGFSSYVTVTGPVTGYNQTGRATCPGGYTILSGGYQVITTSYTFAFGPQIARVDQGTNSFVISGGDPKYGSTWQPYAYCGA